MNPEPADHKQPRHDLSVSDPVLHKTRLLSQQCDTCIFRPGNPMHLNPGRLAAMVAEARTTAGYIICHRTLPYGQEGAKLHLLQQRDRRSRSRCCRA